jgi:DNA-binding transcriptional MerR regulator
VSATAPASAQMSIGEVLSSLRADFPDVTISKIRFLEAEGLVEPARTASGYRKFSHRDVDRLRYVLTAQRDHYLPLRVIKDHLDAIDRGLEPPQLGTPGPRVPRVVVAADGMPEPEAFTRESPEVRLSRAELLAASGVTDAQLTQLEAFGLITKRAGGHYDGDALLVASTVGQMSRFGLEARHLRAFKSAAEREVGLIEQVVAPLARQRSTEARARADEVVRELAALSVRLHAALVRASIGQTLSR